MLERELLISDARVSTMERDLTAKDASISTANQTVSDLRSQVSRIETKAERSERAAIATALVIQNLEIIRDSLTRQVDVLSLQLAEIGDRELQVLENLDLERMNSADLRDKLIQLRRKHADTLDYQLHDSEAERDRPDPEQSAVFDVGEFDARGHSSSTSLLIEFYDMPAHSQVHSHNGENGHLAPESDEPSFSEAAFEFDPRPPSPARTGQSERTLASSNALGDSPHSSRRSGSYLPDRSPSLHPATDLHMGCREHIDELEARIGRRNEQIGLHQAEIEQLRMNLTLVEEANAEHMAEWEAMRAERDQAALERDAMIADCAEARDSRNAALRRMENLDEEIDTLRSESTLLQEQVASTPAIKPQLQSDYDVDQVAALVKEVIFATGRAQHLENALAEAHEALSEACELEGHLLDMRANRDDLSRQLESLGYEYDYVAGELQMKEEEILSLHEAVTQAKSESADCSHQKDAAHDELRDLQRDLANERQHLAAQVESIQQALSESKAHQEALQRAADTEIGRLTNALQDAEQMLEELRVQKEQLLANIDDLAQRDHAEAERLVTEFRTNLATAVEEKELVERRLHETCNSFQEEVGRLSARCSELELEITQTAQSDREASLALSELREAYTRDLAAASAEREAAISLAEDAQRDAEAHAKALQLAEAVRNDLIADTETKLRQISANYTSMESELSSTLNSLSANEHALRVAQEDLQARIEELKRVNGMKRFLETDLKKR